MAKSEVYSWRLSSDLKEALEEAARRERQSVSKLLERIVRVWLKQSRRIGSRDAEEQVRLHKAAARTLGSIRGGNPNRSERVREDLQFRLRQRRAG